MQNLIAIFIMFFMVQMDVSGREITYTTQDRKGKYPLPEAVPLLINEISSTFAEKKELKFRLSRESLKTSLTYNIVNLPKEIRVLIFEKWIPFDDTRKDDQKYCKARNAMSDIVENKPCSLGLLFKAFYVVEARRIPFNCGNLVSTNLNYSDILDLDDDSAAKLHDLLHERLGPCCWGYSKYPSWLQRNYEYPKFSTTELSDLKMIANQQGWNIKDIAEINYDAHDCSCGKCVAACSALSACAGAISFISSCWAKDPACCCSSCASVKAAEITGWSLFGFAGGCLISGAICWASHTCGEDCKPRRALHSITKKTK